MKLLLPKELIRPYKLFASSSQGALFCRKDLQSTHTWRIDLYFCLTVKNVYSVL